MVNYAELHMSYNDFTSYMCVYVYVYVCVTVYNL